MGLLTYFTLALSGCTQNNRQQELSFRRELTPLCVAFVRPSHFNSVDALKNGTEGNGFNSLTMSKKLHTHQ